MSAPPDRPAPIVQLTSLGGWFDAELPTLGPVLRCFDDPESLSREPDAARATVAVTSVRRGLGVTELEALPALKAICSWGVGHETIDVAEAAARGIAVSATPGVLDDCVADHAWALLLATARRIAVADRYVREGEWREIGAFPLSTKVSGKRLGLVGLGRIGAAIARRGGGFDMTVRYNARRPVPGCAYDFEPSLPALAAWADFLVLACPGGAETHHLVDAEILSALGPSGILVNIARGTVVDEDALLTALARRNIGGAGLDVLEREPAVPDALADLDNVVLTPHIGSATRDTRQAMVQLVYDNVASFLERGRLLTPIALRSGQRAAPARPVT